MDDMNKLMNCLASCSLLASSNNEVAMKNVEIKLLKERIAELETMLSNVKTESNNRRTTIDKELEIVKQYYDGKSISLIGREQGVSRNTIYKTLRRNNIEY